jgi:hypothetical protein
MITLQCYHYKTLTSLGAHYITTTLNMETRNAIHVIAIYKPTTLLLSTFLYCIKNI